MSQSTEQAEQKLPAGVGCDGRNIGHLGFFGRIGEAVVTAVSRLPMGALYVFADFIAFILHRVLHYRARVVRQNLAVIFPDATDDEKKNYERLFYRHLSDYFVETVKALTISDDELLNRMKIRNPEVVNDLISQGKSVFVYAAHMGNWEWFTAFPLYHKGARIQCFYQKQEDGFADYMTLKVRTRREIWSVEGHHGFRFIAKGQKEGVRSVTLVIGDQCPHRGAQKFWIDFFGRDTPFLVGPEHIARKLGLALVYPSYVGYERGHYEVEYRVVSADVASEPVTAPTQRFARMLEEDVRRLPHLWLLSHKRWKLKHEDFPEDKQGA